MLQATMSLAVSRVSRLIAAYGASISGLSKRAEVIEYPVEDRCPHACGGVVANRSRRHGMMDFLNSLVGRYPFRCNRCYRRCYRFRRQ